MKELSLHILDLIQNSVRAGACVITLTIEEIPSENKLVITIEDDGEGMPRSMVEQVTNPFITSRTTRKVGLGIPFMDQMCRECNGKLEIVSKEGEGTRISGQLQYNHIDRLPLGDVGETIATLILAKPNLHYIYVHKYEDNEFVFDTEIIKETLGDLPIETLEIIEWIKVYIDEQLIEVMK